MLAVQKYLLMNILAMTAATTTPGINGPDLFSSAAGIVYIFGSSHWEAGSVISKGFVYALISSDPNMQVDDTVCKQLIYMEMLP